MYQNEFDVYLNSNRHFNTYMLWGDEPYLIDLYTQKILKNLCQIEEVNSMYFKEYNFDKALTFLMSNSLFSDCNVVFIKTNKAIPKKEIQSLQQACKQNSNSFLIINCFDDKSDKYLAGKLKTMSNYFNDKGNEIDNVNIRFFSPNRHQALEYLKTEATNISMVANEQSLGYLLDELNDDIYMCINELKKLSPLNEPLNKEMINKYCFNLHNVNIQDFVFDFFVSHDKNIIKHKLQYMLLAGYEEVLLINKFNSFISILIKIKLYTNAKSFNIRAIWGYPLPLQVANMHKDIANKYTINTLHKLLRFFLKIDLELKTALSSNKDSYVVVKLLKLFDFINK